MRASYSDHVLTIGSLKYGLYFSKSISKKINLCRRTFI